MGDIILDHPTLRRRVGALRRLRRALKPTLRQLSVACTLLVPANIRANTRRYRKVRHTQIILRHAIVRQLCYPSKISPPIVINLHLLFGPFFQRGLRSPSYSHIPRATHREENGARNPKNAGDYPIAIHHPWHVTSTVDAASGQQSLMTADGREI